MSELEHLSEQASALGVELTPDACERLLTFEDLLRTRAVPESLVATSDLPRLRERHVLDSLRAVAAVRPADRDAYDLGSGAGLPGVVVAVAMPELAVGLVERRPRRAAFLELVITTLGLENASVVAGRVEDLATPVDVCMARAFAPADDCWRLAEPVLRPDGRLVYFAGLSFGSASVPGAVIVDRLATPVLESAGPVVIMARQ